MTRAIIYFVQLAVLVGIAVWLADRPGKVSIDWLGYRLETYVGILLALGVILFTVLLFAWRLWRTFIGAPGAFLDQRSRRRRDQGYRALSLGMAAVAVGDANEARRLSKEATRLLEEPDLTGLLSAQAASLNGDHDAARRYFEDLRDSDDTKFLGLTGLMRQAIAEGDEARTLRMAEEAWELRPDSPDVVKTLFALQTRRGMWFEAQRTLYDAVRRGLLEEGDAISHRKSILTERARIEAADNKTAEAMKHIDQALDADPVFPPAIALQAELLVGQGKAKRAETVIEEAWRKAPHPDLVTAWRALHTGDDALGLVRRFQNLAKMAPDAVESRIALAEMALDAQLWGEARAQLDAIADDDKPVAACRLMARLEEAENEDLSAARMWLERATERGPDPAWVCEDCGAVQQSWNGLCGNCGTFDTVAWKVAPSVTMLTEPLSDEDGKLIDGNDAAA